MSTSPDIAQNSDWGISNFQISCQPLIKENCHQSRTSDDIEMKLEPLTKLEKKKKTMTKNKNYDDAIPSNFDIF